MRICRWVLYVVTEIEGTVIGFTQEGAVRLLWRLHYRVDQQLVNKLWPSVGPLPQQRSQLPDSHLQPHSAGV